MATANFEPQLKETTGDHDKIKKNRSFGQINSSFKRTTELFGGAKTVTFNTTPSGSLESYENNNVEQGDIIPGATGGSQNMVTPIQQRTPKQRTSDVWSAMSMPTRENATTSESQLRETGNFERPIKGDKKFQTRLDGDSTGKQHWGTR